MFKKYLRLCSLCSVLPFSAYATGMAVSLPNLYLQNITKKAKIVTVKNVGRGGTSYQLAKHSMCRITGPIMFLPFAEESNNFVIMVTNGNNVDPIVIDKSGRLTLAHNSKLGFNYEGNVLNYKLLGFCGNQPEHTKFLKVEAESSANNPPAFNLLNCSSTSNFVYHIKDDNIKAKNHKKKDLDFANVKDCAIVQSE